MAIIPQTRLFCWEDVENLGDLHRLRLVLRTTPDERLMRALEARRARGRDDYPVRAVWNSILAGIVYQHPSIESLRRELLRNDRLRWMCGFDPVLPAEKAVPNAWNYTRFFGVLAEHVEIVDDIFRALVGRLGSELPEFGRHLACDSKEVHTHARPRGRQWLRQASPDGRRDIDADFGKKTYRHRREDGTLEQTEHRWFGYKLHLVVAMPTTSFRSATS